MSVPAGFARMPLGRFTMLTAIGSGVWNALFIYAGYRLGDRWEQVQQYLRPISYTVVAALLITGALLVARQVRHRSA